MQLSFPPFRAACWLTLVLLAASTFAAEPTGEQVAFFEKKVRPLLVTQCVECHGPDAQEGGLRVDSLAALVRGGMRGPAILPGNAKESLLIRAIGHGETLQMPPKTKLPPAKIAELTQWITQGAPWPNEKLPEQVANKTTTPAMIFTEAQQRHWAFQPLAQPAVPLVDPSAATWSAIDRFVFARLKAEEMSFAPPAEKRTLLRRISYDLTGLPPTIAELQGFETDTSPDAVERVVDRLLASPRYGEKYGRHWLDVARYADSNGLDENLAYVNAFRYRDYVIAAFNQDKPYDRFLQEQLAGDLLQPHDEKSEAEGIVATGFLSLGAKMLAEDDPQKMQMDIIDEQIDTLGKCFLGLTLGCARCHHHKYDPIDVLDYYGLAGIFKSTKTMVNHSVVAVWQERPLADRATLARRDAIAQRVAAKRAEADALRSRTSDEILAAERKRAGEYLGTAAVRQQQQAALAKATPLGDLPAAKRAEIAGLWIREAEDFDRGNVMKDSTNYGEGIGVLVNRGERPNFAEYDLEIAKAGVHQLEVRYAAAGARPCKVYINGKLALSAVAGRVTGSWHPAGQKWFVEGLLELPPGKITLRLEQPTFFPHLDKLLLAPIAEMEVPEKPQVSADLKEELIEQWQQALERSKSDSRSIFAPWHAWLAKLDSSSLTDPTIQKVAERLNIVAAKSSRELIEQYAELFAEADAAWRTLKQSSAGKDAQRLSDDVLEAARHTLYDPQGVFATPKSIEAYFPAVVRTPLAEMRNAATALEKTLPNIPEAMAVSEGKPEEVRVHHRGNHLTLGEVAPRRFLRILAGEEQTPISGDRSGRLELARWLTRPDHPLTARVMVNRLWQWHFGAGLVRSSDNFGLLGETPSHPDLLDCLAREFISSGWSMKKMHRQIMSSMTYQQATRGPHTSDPDNRLLSHFSRRRLQAEEIRDALLFVSDGLDFRMGGTYLPMKSRQYVTSTANVNPAIYNQSCRSVYIPVVRSALYDVFQAFDFADPSVLIAQRDATTVAPQALFMLNSQITAQASRAIAEALLNRSDLDDAARIRELFQKSNARDATPHDVARCLAFVQKYETAAQSQALPAARQKAWQALCRSVLAANEFLYVE